MSNWLVFIPLFKKGGGGSDEVVVPFEGAYLIPN